MKQFMLKTFLFLLASFNFYDQNGFCDGISPYHVTSVQGQRVYVSEFSVGNISVIDPFINFSVVAVINASNGTLPFVVESNPANPVAYVTDFMNGTVLVIDTNNQVVSTTITVGGGAGSGPKNLAISPDGTRLYVPLFFQNQVSVVDTTSNLEINTIPVGNFPIDIALSPDGSKAYVINFFSNSLSVIDTGLNSVINTYSVGNDPIGLAISPDGNKVYISNDSDSSIAVLDLVSELVTFIHVGSQRSGPYCLAVHPDGSKVYVSNYLDNQISVVDTSTNTEIDQINVGLGPTGVHVIADGSTLYVANRSEGSVTVINTASDTVIATVFLFANNPSPLKAKKAPTLNPILAPPTNFTGRIISGFSKTFTLKWDSSPDSSVTSYQLSRNGVQIATISANDPYKYADVNQNLSNTYSLISVNNIGTKSQPVTLTLPQQEK